MSTPVYLITLILPFGTLLFIFGMKYYAAIRQAAARKDAEDTYQRLAQQSAQSQAETAAALAAIRNDLSSLNLRLSAVEKLLKEVE